MANAKARVHTDSLKVVILYEYGLPNLLSARLRLANFCAYFEQPIRPRPMACC